MSTFRNEILCALKVSSRPQRQFFLRKWRLFQGHNSTLISIPYPTLSLLFLACLERHPPDFLYEFGYTLFL